MAKDLLVEKIRSMEETLVPIATVGEGEVGKFVFDTSGTFVDDDNPKGHFVTDKEKYSITLKGAASIMLLDKVSLIAKAKKEWGTTDDIYRNKAFRSLKKRIQDDDTITSLEDMHFKCVYLCKMVDHDSGKLILNPRNYRGDREYYTELRVIRGERDADPTGDFGQRYADARKALMDSGVRENGDKEDYAVRPIFVIE